ncbi:MAG: hypothetical protein Q9175_001693 [Cornicularia normoerica]
MFLSKAPSWFLFCALLCWQPALGAHLPRGSLTERSSLSKTQKQHEPRANAIAQPNTIPTIVPAPDVARSVGIHIRPLTAPILPQAVGQVLIQALFTAYIEFGAQPLAVSNSFHHSVSSRVPNFNVEFQMLATGNQTGDFVLTNSRVVETLSLLGFDYSNQQNVSTMVEYNFDVVIDVWMQPEVVIARGSVKNLEPPSEPAATVTAKI